MLKDLVLDYRAKHNLSASEFAKLAGVTLPTVLKIERGEKPSRLVVAKVANALGMSYGELIEKIEHQ